MFSVNINGRDSLHIYIHIHACIYIEKLQEKLKVEIILSESMASEYVTETAQIYNLEGFGSYISLLFFFVFFLSSLFMISIINNSLHF